MTRNSRKRWVWRWWERQPILKCNPQICRISWSTSQWCSRRKVGRETWIFHRLSFHRLWNRKSRGWSRRVLVGGGAWSAAVSRRVKCPSNNFKWKCNSPPATPPTLRIWSSQVQGMAAASEPRASSPSSPDPTGSTPIFNASTQMTTSKSSPTWPRKSRPKCTRLMVGWFRGHSPPIIVWCPWRTRASSKRPKRRAAS